MNRKHGHAATGFRSPEYVVWQGMIARCVNPKHKSYKDYGGRGITVCVHWLYSFENFLKDMGAKPYPSATLDRKKNHLGYFKTNCKWSSKVQQGRNRRDNVKITARGKMLVLTEWAELLGVPENALRIRKRKGWSDHDIVETPVKARMTAAKARQIYLAYWKGGTSTGPTLQELADKHGSTFSTVQAITSGRNWGTVTAKLLDMEE